MKADLDDGRGSILNTGHQRMLTGFELPIAAAATRVLSAAHVPLSLPGFPFPLLSLSGFPLSLTARHTRSRRREAVTSRAAGAAGAYAAAGAGIPFLAE